MLQRIANTAPQATAENTVTGRVLRPLIDAASALGVSRDALLSAAGLTPEAAQNLDQQMSFGTMYSLLGAILAHSEDPAFGLHLAERLPQRAFSVVADLVFYSPNLRESLSSFAKYQALLTSATVFHVHEDARWVRISCLEFDDAPANVQRFTSELMVAGLQRRIRTFAPETTLHAISFRYGPPSYRIEYNRVFDGKARFDQSFTGLVFDRSALDARSPFEDPELHAALSAFGERKVRIQVESASFAARVRQALARERFPRRAEAGVVARALRISTRSLRRKLAAEGTTFAAVAKEALVDRASDCLLQLDRTVQETAFELGFADKGSFHRAFKRWTGMTPEQYRRNKAAASSIAARSG